MSVKISILMPCYNGANTLARAVQSVLVQNDWFELIIINDGSQDNSAAIIDSYTKKYPQIKAVHLPKNGGAALARNIGRCYAQGDILAFLDADDEHDVGFYTFAKQVFESLPSIAAMRVGTKFVNFPAHLLTDDYKQKRHILMNTFIPNMMVKTTCFDLIGGFSTHPVIKRDGGEDGIFSQILQNCFTVGTFYEKDYLLHYWHQQVHAQKFLEQTTEQHAEPEEVVSVSLQLIEEKMQHLAWMNERLNASEKGFVKIMVNA